MRKILSGLFTCCVFLTSPTWGQLTLPVNMVKQRGSNLCWASSMEMILQYYDPANTETQCSLSFLFQEMIGDLPTVATLNCDYICSGGCASFLGDPCNQALPANYISDYGGINISDPANYDLLFSKLGYHSMEDINLLTWAQYVQELNQCRPIIFMYSVTGERSTYIFNHSVVAYGYDQIGGVDYFLIKDPWSDCTHNGNEFLLNKIVLDGTYHTDNTTDQSTWTVNQVLASVHHIYPKEGSPCTDCLKASEENPQAFPPSTVMELVKKHAKDFFAAKDEVITYQELSVLPDEYYRTPIYYLSQREFNTSTGGVTFNDVNLKTNIYEVTYTESDPNLVVTLRCNDKAGQCVVEKIGMQSKSGDKRVKVPGGETIILSNRKNPGGPIPQVTYAYSIVRYPAYPFEFYKFTYQNDNYMYPVDFDSKFHLYSDEYKGAKVALPESMIIKGLQKFTKDELKIADKGIQQVNKVNRKIENNRYIKMNSYLRKSKIDNFLLITE